MTEQQKITFPRLYQQLDGLMLRDKTRFVRRLHSVKKVENPESQQAIPQETAQEISQAAGEVLLREAARPAITYPENLLVSQKEQEILEAVRDHQVVIVARETGSGKTTQLPKICMELGRGLKGSIGHIQPRRLAARTVANRIIEELQTEPGSYTGYKVRLSDHVGDNTIVELMIDGILLAEIRQDHLPMQYDTITIDEAHERSLNINFLLGYLKELLPRRPDLKIIITSAAIDPERFPKRFNHAPIIEVFGRTYPVEARYRPIVEETDGTGRDQSQAVSDMVDELGRGGPGDIPIFMSGEREIRDTVGVLNKLDLCHTEVLPLYARLSNSEQNRVFQPHSGRRTVLVINVVGTSLTVPGIRYVIDPGTACISRYSYHTKMQRLPVEPVSQVSANQCKGRYGRVSKGICIRLYSENDFLSHPEFTDPEILRTDLTSVILQMIALGLDDIAAFPFVEAPDKRNIQDGVCLLEELGATITDEQATAHKLTPIGRQLSQLPVDLRLVRIMLEAQKHGCVREVIITTSALSTQDPREWPMNKQQASDKKHRHSHDKESDFPAFVNLWNYLGEQQKVLSPNQFRCQCRVDFLNYLRIHEWQDTYTQLRQVVKELGLPINSEPVEYREIHTALLTSLLSHIGMKDAGKQGFTGACNIRFSIFPGSGSSKKPPKWTMVAELAETSWLWGRIAARIESEWVEPVAQHLIKCSYNEPHREWAQGTAMATEKVTVYGLLVVGACKANYSQIDPAPCRELFIRHALVRGDWQTRYAFFRKNLKLRAEIEELEHKSRRRDILVDDEILLEFYDQHISHDAISARHFDAWWKQASRETPDLLNFEKSTLIKEGVEQVSKLDYPNFWHQGNLKLWLSYQFESSADADDVTVRISLLLLNQVVEAGLGWQVPGLRHEPTIALVKSLPKPARRNFASAPNYAGVLLDRATPLELPLPDSLECELCKMTGVTIDREARQWDQVPDHLKITFQVVDDKNKKLREGCSLQALKDALKGKVQETLSAMAGDGIEQSGLYIWSLGTLAESHEQKRGNYKVKAWPTLVDECDSAVIKLFDNPQEQQQAMWCGPRRLLLLNIPSSIKYLHEKLSNRAKLGLYFNPYGKVLDPIDDCISCGVDKLIDEAGGPVWAKEGFNQLHDKARVELNDTVMEIAKQIEQILTAVLNINKRLKGRVDMTMALGLSDIKVQMADLVYRGSVTGNDFRRLGDTLRYLQAIEKRLEKMVIGPYHDHAQMLKTESAQQVWQQWLDKLPPNRREDDDVREVRWIIEELRVSLFVQ